MHWLTGDVWRFNAYHLCFEAKPAYTFLFQLFNYFPGSTHDALVVATSYLPGLPLSSLMVISAGDLPPSLRHLAISALRVET